MATPSPSIPAYHPAQVERDAQLHWRETNAYRATPTRGSSKGKFYCVSMLPYPSGKLHMGHVRNYTINDVMYRYLRMQGHNVLMPMGWDAFGLPAENAAMKNGVAPAAWTYENIAYMKKQCQAMGWAIDWSRELATCSPDYYRWNQWLFLKMLERGIAYKKTGTVNWDPVDQTVLANEQVIDGRGWRSGALVEKRDIPMYYLRITAYAEELLATLDRMDGWPDRVKAMQANWIGKSEGVRFAFLHKLRDHQNELIGAGRLFVFTTRADTIMGVTFCAVAPEHPLAARAAEMNAELATFIDECKRGTAMEADLATMEKKGMPTGLSVQHPLTGAEVPVWVGNYVLMSYGDGAVMGVPAHDERDFAFAKRYGLPIKQVVAIEGERFSRERWQPWYEDKQRGLGVNSGKYDQLNYLQSVRAVAADLQALGLGTTQTTYRLRDWGISRQRYWGTPIPIVHCPACGDVPVPETDLPVVLPEDCVPDGSGNPLNKRADFVNTKCPKCAQAAKRETDTMDTFVDSSWYYMRYTSVDAPTMVDEENDYWMPMDQYIGGIEHAILHLLYARFWTKVMRDFGLVRFDEPFTRLLTQGMVLNHIFFRKTQKGGMEYFPPDEVLLEYDQEGRILTATAKRDKQPVEYGGIGTMSKSKLNGVDPQDIIDRFGADTARLYMMFTSPPEQTLEWSDAGVEGGHRFLKRLWAFCVASKEQLDRNLHAESSGNPEWRKARKPTREMRRLIYLNLKQATFDFERIQYNTVVSFAMKMLNALENSAADAEVLALPAGEEQRLHCMALQEGISILVRLVYPITPHICHALWTLLGFASKWGDIIDAPWPLVDEVALVQDEIDLVLQINGKLRGHLLVPTDASREAIEAAALASGDFKRHAQDTPPKKIIVVPGRLVNIVL